MLKDNKKKATLTNIMLKTQFKSSNNQNKHANRVHCHLDKLIDEGISAESNKNAKAKGVEK